MSTFTQRIVDKLDQCQENEFAKGAIDQKTLKNAVKSAIGRGLILRLLLGQQFRPNFYCLRWFTVQPQEIVLLKPRLFSLKEKGFSHKQIQFMCFIYFLFIMKSMSTVSL